MSRRIDTALRRLKQDLKRHLDESAVDDICRRKNRTAGKTGTRKSRDRGRETA
jgi:hypothetical protein